MTLLKSSPNNQTDVLHGENYRTNTGKIGYASNNSRPDLTLSFSMLAKFNANPDASHEDAAEQAIRYAQRTSTYGITFGRSSHVGNTGHEDGLGLWGCVDASYASDPDTLRSRTGWVFFLAGAPIAWHSKRQTSVTKSSAEAEYYALSDAGNQAIWLQRLLHDLGISGKDDPVHIYCDSQSAIAMTSSAKNHSRSKHIDIHWHWIREAIELGKICVTHVAGVKNIADGLTKPLAKPQFDQFRSNLSMTCLK
jgi:hypothetical protein